MPRSAQPLPARTGVTLIRTVDGLRKPASIHFRKRPLSLQQPATLGGLASSSLTRRFHLPPIKG